MGDMIFPTEVNFPVWEWNVKGTMAFTLTLLWQYVALFRVTSTA